MLSFNTGKFTTNAGVGRAETSLLRYDLWCCIEKSISGRPFRSGDRIIPLSHTLLILIRYREMFIQDISMLNSAAKQHPLPTNQRTDRAAEPSPSEGIHGNDNTPRQCCGLAPRMMIRMVLWGITGPGCISSICGVAVRICSLSARLGINDTISGHLLLYSITILKMDKTSDKSHTADETCENVAGKQGQPS